MSVIAAEQPGWYANENPRDLTFDKLAKVFQAQHFAGENMRPEMAALVEQDPWVVNAPWTAQCWLPLSQAAWAGCAEMIDALIEMGADPAAKVGDLGDEVTIAEVARQAGHEGLADRLEAMSGARRP
jgi:hypothetical protein